MSHLTILIPTLDRIGGAESQVALLAEGLVQRGWQVTVITLSGDNAPSADEDQNLPAIRVAKRFALAGVNLFSLRMRKAWIDPRGWMRYLRWASKNRPGIVHAHLPHATWFARWSRPLVPVRIEIDTLHTSRCADPRHRLGYRLSNWLSNRTTCVSEAVAQAASASSSIPLKKLTMLPNGIPLIQSCLLYTSPSPRD